MSAWLDDGDVRLFHGDALEQLALMPSDSVQCIVTSPPFWGLRDYGHDDQIGLESTPDEWYAKLVAVFRECRRVLRSDGVFWLEVGDTYAANRTYQVADNKHTDVGNGTGMRVPDGLKPKDLVGAPWMLAFALRADGWYLRSDTIWARPNTMPESVTDRPTKAHSYVFLLTKSARYFYDADAIREASTGGPEKRNGRVGAYQNRAMNHKGDGTTPTAVADRDQTARNARSVWQIATEPTPFAHFATMPTELARRCIAAGSREGDTVLDPFMGSGTTALVARRMGRHAVGVELIAEYLAIASKRLEQQSLFAGMPA